MLTVVPGKSCFIEEVIQKNDCVILKSERGVLRICVYFDDVVRVSFSVDGTFDEGQGDYLDRKSTRLNSSHIATSRMPSSA